MPAHHETGQRLLLRPLENLDNGIQESDEITFGGLRAR
jgi:hypothetical protein